MPLKPSQRLIQSFDRAEFLDSIVAFGCRLEKHLHIESSLVALFGEGHGHETLGLRGDRKPVAAV
ncbi:MAG: hypothetical protein QOF62_1097 [Pyrinomonadaceae bacterium]|nr:hypothetical protein [Pyrinomonadaceae bacterium]